MKIPDIFLLIAILYCPLQAAEPVYRIDEDFSGRFVSQTGSEFNDRCLDQVTHNGVVWFRIYHLGKLFWARNDDSGNVVLTWDWVEYLSPDQEVNEFILFHSHPTLGEEWNPDGVSIRIDGVQEPIEHNGEAVRADRYSFLGPNQEIAVECWVQRGVGVIRMNRTIYGNLLTHVRQLSE